MCFYVFNLLIRCHHLNKGSPGIWFIDECSCHSAVYDFMLINHQNVVFLTASTNILGLWPCSALNLQLITFLLLVWALLLADMVQPSSLNLLIPLSFVKLSTHESRLDSFEVLFSLFVTIFYKILHSWRTTLPSCLFSPIQGHIFTGHFLVMASTWTMLLLCFFCVYCFFLHSLLIIIVTDVSFCYQFC